MYNTIESRWFSLGEVPVALLNWFNACPGTVEHQPLRRDLYLPLGEGDGLGVKVRDGDLEIKQRRQQHGQIQLSGTVFGLVEEWTKWRFPLAEPETPILNSGSDAWLAVDKQRQLRRYQVSASQEVKPAAPETTIYAGCEVEFTVLWAGGRLWWTVAFEAFGESAGNHARLMTVAKTLLAELTPGLLSAANSYGYPHLLAGLAANC